MTPRTRFAPSPTGYLHIGGARTALFAWLFARHHGGQFILRVEDTDRERSTPESIQAILDGMNWLGLDYDEGPFYQSERMARYREVADDLLARGLAYHCYCTREELDALREAQMQRGEKPRYDGRYRDYQGPPREGVEPVLRFRNPQDGHVVFDDQVRGRIRVSNAELDDLVILRADGTPTYNFCVVIDDLDMEITHVIRGDDHINNTPRQINIFHALGTELPHFAHVPMILGSDGKRLSKRHGATSVLTYREQGYLSEALLNGLVRLGWSHGDQEIFSRDDMIALFDLDGVNRAAATFDPARLDWLNQHYLRHSDADALNTAFRAALLRAELEIDAGPPMAAVLALYSERCATLDAIANEAHYLYRPLTGYDPTAADKHLKSEAAPILKALHTDLGQCVDWHAEMLNTTVKSTTKALGVKMGKVGMPLRVALTGTANAPSIDQLLWLLGRRRSLERIEQALAYIEAQ